jgi:hypothetical protein
MQVPEIKIDYIEGNCPVQAEGSFNGVEFYFRARGKRWSIEVGKSPKWNYEEPYGSDDFSAGWVIDAEAVDFIEKAAILWSKNSC